MPRTKANCIKAKHYCIVVLCLLSSACDKPQTLAGHFQWQSRESPTLQELCATLSEAAVNRFGDQCHEKEKERPRYAMLKQRAAQLPKMCEKVLGPMFAAGRIWPFSEDVALCTEEIRAHAWADTLTGRGIGRHLFNEPACRALFRTVALDQACTTQLDCGTEAFCQRDREGRTGTCRPLLQENQHCDTETTETCQEGLYCSTAPLGMIGLLNEGPPETPDVSLKPPWSAISAARKRLVSHYGLCTVIKPCSERKPCSRRRPCVNGRCMQTLCSGDQDCAAGWTCNTKEHDCEKRTEKCYGDDDCTGVCEQDACIAWCGSL